MKATTALIGLFSIALIALLGYFLLVSTVSADHKPGSCVNHCGEKSPDGCFCDQLSFKYNDHCQDMPTVCPDIKPPSTESTPPAGSCAGYCGSHPTGYSCYCDVACEKYGDCCSDYSKVCVSKGDVILSAVLPGGGDVQSGKIRIVLDKINPDSIETTVWDTSLNAVISYIKLNKGEEKQFIYGGDTYSLKLDLIFTYTSTSIPGATIVLSKLTSTETKLLPDLQVIGSIADKILVNKDSSFVLTVINSGSADVASVEIKIKATNGVVGITGPPNIAVPKGYSTLVGGVVNFTSVGPKTFTVIVDPNNKIDELDETNNKFEKTVLVVDSTPGGWATCEVVGNEVLCH